MSKQMEHSKLHKSWATIHKPGQQKSPDNNQERKLARQPSYSPPDIHLQPTKKDDDELVEEEGEGKYAGRQSKQEEAFASPASLPSIQPMPSSSGQRFTAEQDALLRRLKEVETLSWKEMVPFFPGRKSRQLQTRYLRIRSRQLTVSTSRAVPPPKTMTAPANALAEYDGLVKNGVNGEESDEEPVVSLRTRQQNLDQPRTIDRQALKGAELKGSEDQSEQQPTKADTAEKKSKKGVPVVERTITASQASVLIMVGRGVQKGEYKVFGNLGSEFCFNNLGQTLQDYSSTQEGLSAPKRVAAEALIALSINDHSCMTGKPGRMRHSWGVLGFSKAEFDRPLYFSMRVFSADEKSNYLSWSPRLRLDTSSVFVPYHWKGASTLVKTVRFLESRQQSPDKHGLIRMSFYVAGDTVEEARQNKSRVIIWMMGRLFSVNVSEILTWSKLGHKKPTSIESQLMKPMWNLSSGKKGFCQIELWVAVRSSRFEDWASDYEVPSDSLAESLRHQLVCDILGGGGEEWGPQFDRLVELNATNIDFKKKKSTQEQIEIPLINQDEQ